MSDAYEQVTVRSRTGWRAWLSEHHRATPGIWLVTYKKASGGPYVAYGDIVEESLCFGWVDSVPRKLDAERSQLLVTPRKRGSRWSKANKDRIEQLTAAGLMAPAGLAAVERAKADGSWSALDAVEALIEPDDLRAALDGDEEARRQWDGFPPSTWRGILEWILAAKRPATRVKRVTETVTLAAEGVRANQWTPPTGR